MRIPLSGEATAALLAVKIAIQTKFDFMIFDGYLTSLLNVSNGNLFDVPWLINGIAADMKLLLKELCSLGFGTLINPLILLLAML